MVTKLIKIVLIASLALYGAISLIEDLDLSEVKWLEPKRVEQWEVVQDTIKTN